MANKEEIYDNASLELRRGTLTLAVLSQLDEPQYGYSLKQRLAERGVEINEGTLYPLLRRLEKQGLLSSDWQVVDDKRPRRYYQLNDTGKLVLLNLRGEWDTLIQTMDGLLNGRSGAKQ